MPANDDGLGAVLLPLGCTARHRQGENHFPSSRGILQDDVTAAVCQMKLSRTRTSGPETNDLKRAVAIKHVKDVSELKPLCQEEQNKVL